MKIVNFTGTFRKGDGVTRVILALIREANGRELESLVVTGWTEGDLLPLGQLIEVPSVVFPLYKDYHLSLPGIKNFEKKLDKFGPDIIHVHSPDTLGWAALRYAKKRNLPILATNHTDFTSYLRYYHIDFLKPLAWLLLKELYSQMSLVTTPSPDTTRELRQHGILKVKTIPWGVDLEVFNPAFRSEIWREKILKGRRAKILLCTCRLTKEKDLDILAETHDLLKKNRDDFILVIVGDGPYRKELELMMPQALFLGYQEGRALSEAYASSDILLFPSTTETFGNVTLEAMASGVVPVVANAGGSKSLVQDGKTGLLALPRNAGDFYKKTVRLLDNREMLEEMRVLALEISKKFSWQKIFDRFLEEYSRLSKVKRPFRN